MALSAGRPAWALPSTLPFGARTFLERFRPRPPGRLLRPEYRGRIIVLVMRRAAPFLALLALVACGPQVEGPVAPLAVEQFAAGSAFDASASRQAVVNFVDAYAASPTEGAGALANLVWGEEMAAWVRWLDVQHHEFPGAIDALADIRDVEFVESLQARRARGAHVGLSATVTFRFAPEGAAAFELARILDGPVTLVRGEDGTYLVFDLLRDGVPMSDGIQVFRNESRTAGEVEVVLDSLFMFQPYWQFNVVVSNRGTEPLVVDREGVGLYVGAADTFERLEGTLTGSLEVIPPGDEVAGLLTYPIQDSAEGRVLTLVYGSGRDALRFEFPLEGLVSAVPPPPPTGEETAVGVTG